MSITETGVVAYLCLFCIELFMLLIPPFWRIRKLLSTGIVVGIVVLTLWVFMQTNPPVAIVFSFVSVYRIINLTRIIEGRMHSAYLRRVVIRSSLWLVAIQLLLTTSVYILHPERWSMLILSIAQVFVAMWIVLNIMIGFRRSKLIGSIAPHAQRDLPTVSVCIPARNETTALFDCLESIVNSSYPKLETIVFDDCSQTATSDVVKHFAHAGVRFIHGEEPHLNWLAKNQAYDALSDAATGDIILFCGVDVRFEKDSIQNAVQYMIENKLDMISILPSRVQYSITEQIIQPLRYWWELAIPRYLLVQPPSLSSCWLIQKDALDSKGSFDAVSRRVRPETYFARETHKSGKYQFLRSTNEIAVTTLKPPRDQFNTAIRVRYPEMHKRPESVLSISFFIVVFLLEPYATVLKGLYTGIDSAALIALFSIILLTVAHVIIMRLSNPKGAFLGIANLPFVFMSELYLINESMYRYEFSTVEWKGRNICLPVMHVTPKLPDIDATVDQV